LVLFDGGNDGERDAILGDSQTFACGLGLTEQGLDGFREVGEDDLSHGGCWGLGAGNLAHVDFACDGVGDEGAIIAYNMLHRA
jgi:hypothetical protein